MLIGNHRVLVSFIDTELLVVTKLQRSLRAIYSPIHTSYASKRCPVHLHEILVWFLSSSCLTNTKDKHGCAVCTPILKVQHLWCITTTHLLYKWLVQVL